MHRTLIDTRLVDPSPRGDGELLRAVHALLRAKIGLEPKIALLTKAMVIYLNEPFQSNSAVLQSFVNANDRFLRDKCAQGPEDDDEDDEEDDQ